MKRRPVVNVSASVRAKLLKLSKQRQEDFMLTLLNYTSERFLYRLARSKHRDRFIVKGAILLAVRIGEAYRPTRDLDFLGIGDPSEQSIDNAIRDIVSTDVQDDGLVFDVSTLEVRPIREDNRYGGLRANMQVHLAAARIPLQIDIGFGDVITPGTTELDFPTLLDGMPSPHVRAYTLETVVAEKVEAMVSLGMLNSRMKDFFDVALLARRTSFDGGTLVRALQATFTRRATRFPDGEMASLTGKFAEEASANWRAFAKRTRQHEFENLEQVISELRGFLLAPVSNAKAATPFALQWAPGGPWR